MIADRADRLMSAVPIDANDLPGWAVGMYDENVRHPELVRLMAWLRLERRSQGRLSDASTTSRRSPPSPAPRRKAGYARATRPT